MKMRKSYSPDASTTKSPEAILKQTTILTW